MTEENKKQERVNKMMRENFKNTLIESTIPKKLINEILCDKEKFEIIFNIYLLGCKDMHELLELKK